MEAQIYKITDKQFSIQYKKGDDWWRDSLWINFWFFGWWWLCVWFGKNKKGGNK